MRQWTVLFMVAAGFGAGIACYYYLSAKPVAPPPVVPVAASTSANAAAVVEQAKPKIERPKLFPSGAKPDLCLLFSGEMYGYLQPCGCTRPQVGGLERRFELIKELQDKGIPVSAVDLGDLAAHETGRQPRMKFEFALQMLQKMPYSAIGLGVTEFDMTAEEALALALNYQPPAVLAANLLDPDSKRFAGMYKAWTTAQPDPKGLKVGYVGLIGDTVIKLAMAKDKTLQFDPPEKALPKALEELKKEKPDVLVLVLQGTPAEAKQLFEKFPDTFHILFSRADADVPSALPTRLKNPSGHESLLVNVGQKGRAVGLVAVNRAEKWLELRYQMVELVEPYELPDNETNPVRELMKDYVLAVYREDLLSKVPISDHPIQRTPGFENAAFVGAAKCQECHPTAHKIWSGAKHFLATTNLAKYGRPLAEMPVKDGKPQIIGREYDPECASCHVTGFGLKSGFIDYKKSPHLLGNQCENCHGPGSLHVADAKNTKYSTPMRLSIEDPLTEKRCRLCHDADNDPHFDLRKYWEQIKHGKEQTPPPGK